MKLQRNIEATIFIKKEYLRWVVETYGPDHPVMSTNCNGKPIKLGDYVYIYGTAQDLLNSLYPEAKK